MYGFLNPVLPRQVIAPVLSGDQKENREKLMEILIILGNCACEFDTGEDQLLLITLPNGSMLISGKIYLWPLRFFEIVESEDLKQLLTEAVYKNRVHFQPAVRDLQALSLKNKEERIVSALRYSGEVGDGLIDPKKVTIEKYHAERSAISASERSEVVSRVWIGFDGRDPIDYLKRLGVTHLKFAI